MHEILIKIKDKIISAEYYINNIIQVHELDQIQVIIKSENYIHYDDIQVCLEDYELLFTIDQADFEKVKANLGISVIGYITEPGEGKHLITRAGNKHALVAQGWTAFDPARSQEEPDSAADEA